jgi:wobble nucleotide-excising tRNase
VFRKIDRLENFGIFDAYVRPQDMDEFSDRNVIYGWNYSGKTTVSRLFAMLGSGAVYDDFAGCRFSVSVDGSAAPLTEESIGACQVRVQVFNTDFVERNLRWDGTAFNPILLLGQDSLEVQSEIEELEQRASHCTQQAAEKAQLVADDNESLSAAKTAEAKTIKFRLNLVEPFHLTHLDKIISTLDQGTPAILTAEQLAVDERVAKASDADQLGRLQEIKAPSDLQTLYDEAVGLIQQTPRSSSSIPRLVQNEHIAHWVQQGLELHSGSQSCEFCQGTLSPSRVAELEAHFSTAFREYIHKLKDLWGRMQRSEVTPPQLHANDFYPQFRAKVASVQSDLTTFFNGHGSWIAHASGAVNNKWQAPFKDLPIPNNPKSTIEQVSRAVKAANDLIRAHNEYSSKFVQERQDALSRLKKHFAAEFVAAQGISRRLARNDVRARHSARYRTLAVNLRKRISQLQAQIDKAEYGRKRINERIVSLLGMDGVQIGVVTRDGGKQFQLLRNGQLAKRLSEGERTAIAFSFFLTKLEEEPDLSQVVVFIDDPISSLDSNHVFQVSSILRTTFFEKVTDANGNDSWQLKCRQLFLSTHNFEFFGQLQKLPHSKTKPLRFFHTKRLGPKSSILCGLPRAIGKYSSEYHYLFSVLHNFKENVGGHSDEQLLAVPNAARRFLEMYTYSRLPFGTVDQRAARLFGEEKSLRIVKLLHHFSHLESLDRMSGNSDLIADIEQVIADIFQHLTDADPHHLAVLTEAIA